MQFTKSVPNDYTPAPEAGVIASCSYKNLQRLYTDKEIYFIGYYNTGVHFRSWEAARDKYNQLTSIKR